MIKRADSERAVDFSYKMAIQLLEFIGMIHLVNEILA